MFLRQGCNYSSLSESRTDSDMIRIKWHETDEVTRVGIASNQLDKNHTWVGVTGIVAGGLLPILQSLGTSIVAQHLEGTPRVPYFSAGYISSAPFLLILYLHCAGLIAWKAFLAQTHVPRAALAINLAARNCTVAFLAPLTVAFRNHNSLLLYPGLLFHSFPLL